MLAAHISIACKRILADVTEAERAAAGEYAAPTGELVVTAPVVFGRVCLIPILVDFLKAYPDIDVSLVMTDRVLSLLQEEIDVGLRIGALPDSSMVAIRVGAFHRVVCASPTYLAARGTPRTPEDLAGHDCISVTALFSVTGCLDIRQRQDERCGSGACAARCRQSRRPVTQRAPASELPPWVFTLSRQLWSAER